jgi:hypothetical protein
MADSTTYAAVRITYRGSHGLRTHPGPGFGERVPLIGQAAVLKPPVAGAARAEPEAEATARLGPTGLVSLIRVHQGACSASAASAVGNIENSQRWAERRALNMKKAGPATPADPPMGRPFPAEHNPTVRKEQPMTGMDGRPILVAGATGRQGGSVVRHLLARHLTVRALVLDPRNDRVRALTVRGVEIAQGDMDDLASLKKAMAGAHGVYSVQDYFTAGAAREVRQGMNMADAALDAGVEHFVFSTVGGVERRSGIPHFETKWQIENHIRKRDFPPR